MDDALLVDRASAAQRLTDDDFRAWAESQRVFISSVMADLSEERKAVADRIHEVGAEPVWFEEFGGRDDDPEAAYLNEVQSSNIYVGILGRRYGKLLPSRFSATHAEYLSAEEHGLRICVWVSEDPDREGHQHSFVEEVRTFHVTGRFQTPNELANDVERRLRRIAAEDLAPWCKLGPIIFRAKTITEGGDRIEVLSDLRNDAVVARIEEMRSERWGMGYEGVFTYRGRVRKVRVENVEIATTAASRVGVRIKMSIQEEPRPSTEDYCRRSLGPSRPHPEIVELQSIGKLVLISRHDNLWEHAFEERDQFVNVPTKKAQEGVVHSPWRFRFFHLRQPLVAGRAGRAGSILTSCLRRTDKDVLKGKWVIALQHLSSE